MGVEWFQGDDPFVHEVSDRCSRVGQHEILQGEHPNQAIIAVGRIDVVDGFDLACHLAQVRDSLLGCQIGPDSNEFGGHDAAGRVFRIRQQLADILGLIRCHQVEQILAALVRQFGQQVGGLIRRHLFQQIGYSLIGHPFHQAGLEVWLDLFQGVGHGLKVERIQKLAALVAAQVADDLCEIGRMHLRQLLARGLEAHRCVAGQQFHGLPGDAVRGCLSPQPVSDFFCWFSQAQAAHQAEAADVHIGDEK